MSLHTVDINTHYTYLDENERRQFAEERQFTVNQSNNFMWVSTPIMAERQHTIINRNGDLISSLYINIRLPSIIPNQEPVLTFMKSPIYKIIQSEKNQCMISYNTIKSNCKYWQCDVCNNAAIYSYINKWFQSHNTCPTCRNPISKDEITYYINAKDKQ